jgi:thioredoxin-related protein
MQTQLSRLLSLLSIFHTRTHSENIFAYDDGSIVYIKYALASYRLDSLAAELSAEHLEEIPTPAFVLLDANRPLWAVLEKTEGDNVRVFDGKKTYVISREAFCERWTGKTILVEKNEHSAEHRFIENRSRERSKKSLQAVQKYLAGLFFVLLFLHVAQVYSSHLSAIGLFGLSCVGLAVSAILLLGEKDTKSEVFKAACALSSFGNCAETVQNGKAFFIKGFTWAEAAFAYFLFFVLSFLFAASGLAAQSVSVILHTTAFLGVFTGIYSLYVQKFEQKQWCFLCLMLVSILFLSAVPFFFAPLSVPKTEAVLLPFYFASVIAYFSILVIRYYFAEQQNNQNEKSRLTAFLHDEESFFAGLSRSRQIECVEVPDDFTAGNPNANFDIIMVSRPSCKPCAAAHREIDDLTAMFGTYMRVRTVYVFSPDANDPERQYTEKKLREKGLNTPQTERALQKHADFIQSAHITHTPTFIVNGHFLPENYRLQDLAFFAVNL